MATWKSRFTRYDAERVLGAFVGIAKIGPGAREPFSNKVLEWIGVFKRPLASWKDAEKVEAMPWGALHNHEFPVAHPPAGFDGPWPQKPITHSGFSPPILNVSRDDRQQNLRQNIARYLGQMVTHTPGAAFRALKGPRLKPISDGRIADLFANTSLAQFICPALDPGDRAAFAGLIPPGEEASFAKLDFSALSIVAKPLPGIYCAPTVSLLRNLDDDTYRFEAIKVGDKVIRPGDGPSWMLAKYFVVQGAQIHLVIMVHPTLHFPQDAINAIGRTILPQGHLLSKLLRPHGELTLGLHEAVIHQRRSVVHNSQREIYTPFPFTTEGNHKTIVVGLEGVAGNSAYPAFQYGRFLPGQHTLYGKYRKDWFDAVHDFTEGVVSRIPANDSHVTLWADHVSEWLKGFPNGRDIHQEGALAQAAANYICAVSIFHTADHHSYANIPLDELPWRLRVPPPNVQEPQSLDLAALVSSEDYFRYRLCHAMFFKPVVLRSLREVRYDFTDAGAHAAETKFRQSMDALDAKWANSTFPGSAKIACSLQY